MQITLIQPPIWLTESPPYSIALLAAILKKRGHGVICVDLNIELYHYFKKFLEEYIWSIQNEKIDYWAEEENTSKFIDKYDFLISDFVDKIINTKPQILGFTVHKVSMFFSLEIAKRIKEKERDKIIIFGGPQCFRNCLGLSLLENHPWIDLLCFGEADNCLPDLLDRLEENNGRISFCNGFGYKNIDGKIIDCGNAKLVENLDKLPFADFSEFYVERYTQKTLPISTSRGCINRCPFCNESVHWKKYRTRTSENIFAEITYQLNKYPYIEEFWFNDSLVNGNIENLSKLCDLIIKSAVNMRWSGQATIRNEMTKELLYKLKKSGCAKLNYGVENGSNKVLKLMRKGYTAETAERVIRDTHEAGIDTGVNIIVGFPGEEDTEFQETVQFLIRNISYIDCLVVSPLFVLPHSKLDIDRERWNIEPADSLDIDHFWQTKDKRNNFDERIKRANICKEIAQERCFTSWTEGDLSIKAGDLFFSKGQKDLALNCYLKAKEMTKNYDKINMIEEKIKIIKS